MGERKVKIVGKHREGCYAVAAEREGRWHTCWGCAVWRDDPFVATSRRCGKTGTIHKRWLRIVCNDPECPAKLHIEESFILDAALLELNGAE